MHLANYEEYFTEETLIEAARIIKSQRVHKFVAERNGQVTAEVWVEKICHVEIKINQYGETEKIHCSCSETEDCCCKHVAAVLEIARKKIDPISYIDNSYEIKEVLDRYHRLAKEQSIIWMMMDDKVHLIPELEIEHGQVRYFLKIGRTKRYIVQDIPKLMRLFANREYFSYGKELAFYHCEQVLDEKSRKLLMLSAFLCSKMPNHAGNSKMVTLEGDAIEQFFSLFRNDTIIYDGRKCEVRFENPPLELTLRETQNCYTLLHSGQSWLVGGSKRACFYDMRTYCFYIADEDFSLYVSPLFGILQNATSLVVARNDISAFYSSVFKVVSQYIKIFGLELLDYVPPELEAILYLDYQQPDRVTGKLCFRYGDEVYKPGYMQSMNAFCDYLGEGEAIGQFQRYFKLISDEELYLYYMEGNDAIYHFLSEGLPVLSERMVIYATNAFQHMKLHKPARPNICVRTQGSDLLELEVTVEGVTADELRDMFGAYRQGKKYHRLKDGSFIGLSEAFSEFVAFTESLGVSEKAWAKKKIQIPQYRMLYLDIIQKSNGHLTIQRDEAFVKTLQQYHAAIEDAAVNRIPESLRNVMREYQVYGCRWMQNIAAYRLGGILADDMGLGKTLQAIAVMLRAKEVQKKHQIHLVVCPTSLVLNWQNELHRFAPSLRVIVLTGTAETRSKLLSQEAPYDVVITSYATLTRDIANYESFHFYYQFIDEAQCIKNHLTYSAKAVKQIHAEVRFALTGTPVENSLAELWSIFDYIMPGYLFDYSYFKRHYETVIVQQRDEYASHALQKLISPFILRRMKKDVLKELPEKIETVLYSEMEERQSYIYSMDVMGLREKLKGGMKGSEERMDILARLTRLRQICCDPYLVEPLYFNKSGKLTQCMDLIEQCIHAGHKILLFSQFKAMLETLEYELYDRKISHFLLTGETKASDRIRMVNHFNEDNTSVFLISLKAGGTGLNLTGADIVILFEPWWNLSAENQAADRAYRIGQKQNVQIYKLIAKGTIEEKIQALQLRKAELAELVYSGGSEGNMMHMSVEEIIELLEI